MGTAADRASGVGPAGVRPAFSAAIDRGGKRIGRTVLVGRLETAYIVRGRGARSLRARGAFPR